MAFGADDSFFAYLTELFSGVIDDRTDLVDLALCQRIAVEHICFFTDHTCAVIQNVTKCFVFAVDVTHKMLRAFGQVQDRRQVDDLPRKRTHGRVFL